MYFYQARIYSGRIRGGLRTACVQVPQRPRHKTEPCSACLFRRQYSHRMVMSLTAAKCTHAVLRRAIASSLVVLVCLNNLFCFVVAAEPTDAGAQASSQDHVSSVVRSKKAHITRDKEPEKRDTEERELLKKENLERTQSLVRDMWQSLE
mmetsp:Transcript_3941/g.7993  ORF Transcript_3941/g.7993 Transcript_3941/m.7993 type:complete len:150 (+) Transcript_3941:163-612(+)